MLMSAHPATPVKGVGVSVVPTLELDVDVNTANMCNQFSNKTFCYIFQNDNHQHSPSEFEAIQYFHVLKIVTFSK